MARYTAGCSSVGGYSYASNFTLYVDLTEKWIDPINNTSYVDYNVYCQSSGSGSLNANHYKYFSIDGGEKINTTERVNVSSPNAYIGIASGTIGPLYHDSSGNRSVNFHAELSASSYGLSASVSGTFYLSQIPRYTTVYNSERGKTINSISVNWSTTDARDWTQYSLNGSSWQNAYDTVASDNKSGYYTISGLNPNTQYSVKTRCRRTDSGLWSEAGTIYITTYDIARLTTYPNFNIGDSVTVRYTNPSNSSIQVGLYKDGSTAIAPYRNCGGSSYTFNFTDAELDTMYKFMDGNSLDAYFYINTNNNAYRDYKQIRITLTGNQKTIRTNINSIWKRGKLWIKINNFWKRAVVWKNENGTWKRGI